MRSKVSLAYKKSKTPNKDTYDQVKWEIVVSDCGKVLISIKLNLKIDLMSVCKLQKLNYLKRKFHKKIKLQFLSLTNK